jgi:hypothetical protein
MRSVSDEGLNPGGVLASTEVAAPRAARYLDTMMGPVVELKWEMSRQVQTVQLNNYEFPDSR